MSILIRDILALLPDGERVTSVTVQDGIIASVGKVPDGFIADKTISGVGKMLIPGLVNAHTHASMSILRNTADDLTFNDWLFGRIMPLEDKLTGEDCYWGMLLGIMEMLSTGTTTFSDMYFFLDDLVRACRESGIRAVLSQGMTGTTDDGGERLKKLETALKASRDYAGIDTLTFMLAPHAPYTCDETFQREVADAAATSALPIHTHLSESRAEMDTIRDGYGVTPPALMDKMGLLTGTTVAAHGVYLTDDDIALLARRGVSVATNPVSNLKLANGVAPVPKMLAAGLNVCLGTDGAASNNTLNMVREMGCLCTLHKGITGDPLAVSARTGFEIATKNGAKALGLDGVGEIQVGMKADLAILDLDRPNIQPLNNPLSALVYSANGSEVETVMVGGRLLYENRAFLTIDRDRVLFEINRICERIGTQ